MRSCGPALELCSDVRLDALWDVDDLIQRLCEALDVAESRVRELGVEDEDDPERPAGVDGARLIAETGRLLLAASAAESYAAVGPRIQRVADLLLPHALSVDVLRAICLEPAIAFEHAAAYICLKRLGYYDADFDALLDLSVAAQASGGRERVPHRMLEREWLKQGWVYPEGLPRLKAGPHMAQCMLTQTMDLLAGSREDARSFARALMCLRDFNLFPRPLPRARETLLAEAEGLLARCLEQEDYDLAAEVLMAWPLTGEGWSAAAAFGFRVVMEEAGSECLDRDLDGVYAIGMLCAACLSPGRRPPVGLPGSAGRTGVVAAVMTCFITEGPISGWQRAVDAMDAAEREPLAGFLLCLALQRGFARRDVAAMERVLALSKRLGIPACPAGIQATEMMARVSQCGIEMVPAREQVEALQVCVC